MTETLTNTQIGAEPQASVVATSWLQGLAARGITTRIVNGRIRHFPASAYKSLTDDEVLTLRHHRAAIKALINAGVTFDVVRAPANVEKATPALKPEPVCPFCMGGCVGPEHHAYATLHALDPEFIKKRDIEQREKDKNEWEMRRRFGLPSPTWDL